MTLLVVALPFGGHFFCIEEALGADGITALAKAEGVKDTLCTKRSCARVHISHASKWSASMIIVYFL